MVPSTEIQLRVLVCVAFEMFTGIREEQLTHVRLEDIEFLWMQSTTTGEWVPGVLLDYKKLKFTPDPFRAR